MTELFKGLQQIEQAREQLRGASFMSGLYLGKADFELLRPRPEPSEERAEGEAYCRTIESFLKNHVDAQQIERSGEISEAVLKGSLNLRFIKPTPITGPLQLHARVTDISNERKYSLSCDVSVDAEVTVMAEVIAFLVWRSDVDGESLFSGK